MTLPIVSISILLFFGFLNWRNSGTSDLKLLIEIKESPNLENRLEVFWSTNQLDFKDSKPIEPVQINNQLIFQIPSISENVKIVLSEGMGIYRISDFRILDSFNQTLINWTYKEPALPGCSDFSRIVSHSLSTEGIVLNTNGNSSFVCSGIQEKIEIKKKRLRNSSFIFFSIGLLLILLAALPLSHSFQIVFFRLVTTLGVIEMTSFVVSFFILSSLNSRADFNTILEKTFYELSIEEVESEKSRAVHPFTGFVKNPIRKIGIYKGITPSDQVNLFGLTTDFNPQNRDSSTIIVGIAGGSVAQQLVRFSSNELIRHFKNVKTWENKKIVIFPLALSGFKQPQQLMLFSYLASLNIKFDLIINLDGFNEVALPFAENREAGVHYSYPRGWQHLVGAEKSFKYYTHFYQIGLIRKLRRNLLNFFENNLSSRAYFGNLLWYSLDLALKNYSTKIKLELYKGVEIEKHSYESRGPILEEDSKEKYIEKSANLWFESSRLLSTLCNGLKIPYIHFLQPNQYDPTIKKTFQIEERKIAINENQPFRHGVEAGYPLLLKLGSQLKGEGIQFISLTSIFDSIDVPIFKDDCCHLNAKGNSILAQEIGKKTVSFLNQHRPNKN